LAHFAVKRFGTRYVQWALASTAAACSPWLNARMPMYRRTRPMIEVGQVATIEETQRLHISPEETLAAARTREGIPAEIMRSVALIRLEDVTLMGNSGSVVDERQELLLTPRGARKHVTYHEFRPRPTNPITKPTRNYFNMLGPHSGHRHFFHFLIDRLPKLHYLLERFALGQEPITVLVNDNLPAFQRDIYRFIAERYPNVLIEAVPASERWRLPKLYYLDDYQPLEDNDINVEHTFTSRASLDFTRKLILGGYGVVPHAARRRLYVSRNDTRKRHVRNEDALYSVLLKMGFEIVTAGTLSFREQATLFSQAEIICGPHGAGLTNMLFAPQGARIIEILPENKILATYFMLAKSLGHSYSGLVGGRGRRAEAFRVHPPSFAQAMEQIVATGEGQPVREPLRSSG
jgi:hypothetical protein